MAGRDDKLSGWFAGRLPEGWFTRAPEVTYDRDEILVVGTLPDVEAGDAASDETREGAREGRVRQFREDTREQRMRIAREAERRYGRKVAWGIEIGGERQLFTTMSVPVMTRLRMREREVLDTLVDAGVARSRSHALAWCVALVADRQGEWLSNLQEALVAVQKVRAEGPDAAS
ncbi:MAG TPA: hypothetical protein VID47_04500 [Actinomycetota bacterium]